MSWIPILQLGGSTPPTKKGKIFFTSSCTTVTFEEPFLDNNYTVLLTPFVNHRTSLPPSAWVIYDSSFKAESFSIGANNVSGVFWMAIYGCTTTSDPNILDGSNAFTGIPDVNFIANGANTYSGNEQIFSGGSSIGILSGTCGCPDQPIYENILDGKNAFTNTIELKFVADAQTSTTNEDQIFDGGT
jgi:hypothetical protein